MKKLLVIALIVFTFSLVGFLFLGVICSVERTFEDVMDSDLNAIETAIAAYYDRHKRYPETLQQLIDDGFLKKLVADPWGYEYQYSRGNGKYVLESKGYKLESNADITN